MKYFSKIFTFQVGERLGRYEVEKRRAIETEDYDLAKVKKIQMDEYRLKIYKQLELHDLLEMSKVRDHACLIVKLLLLLLLCASTLLFCSLDCKTGSYYCLNT